MARTPKPTPRLPLRANAPGRGLLLTSLALLCLGVVMVHSAVAAVAHQGPWYSRLDVRHTLFAAVAALVLAAGWLADYRLLAGRRDEPARMGRGDPPPRSFPWPAAVLLALAGVCAALVFVPGVGHAVGGKYRWIRLGPRAYAIGFQPSELLKIALVAFLAAWLARPGASPRTWRSFVPAAGAVAACLALVVTQDLGTAMVIAAASWAALLLAGVPWTVLAGLLAAGGGAAYYFVMAAPYRMARFTAMVDPLGSVGNPSAYQPRQSLLSVVTGGMTGKGLGRGTIKLGYLPEAPTDFIFSTYCEEWGLVGALLLLGLIVCWLWHAWRATLAAPTPFGRLLCGGLGFLIGLQAVLHVAVDLVACPPTGMGLPFVSAGGTALVTTAGATALMISVSARRRPGDAPGREQ